MPLKKGYSRKTIEANIQEIVDKWQKTGKIGNSKPKTKKKAVEQAVAIALRIAEEAKQKRKG